MYTFIVDEKQTEASPADLPALSTRSTLNDRTATLTVRDRFWDAPTPCRATSGGSSTRTARARITLDGGFEPGRLYEVDYPATGAQGRRRRHGGDSRCGVRVSLSRPTCRFAGAPPTSSASRRAVASCVSSCTTASTWTKRIAARSICVWPHIAGAGQGSFNERFATPGYNTFSATRFPFADAEQAGPDGKRDGILAALPRRSSSEGDLHEHVGRILGPGALGCADAHDARWRPATSRCRRTCACYLLAGTQHGEAAFPPDARGRAGTGEPDAAGQRHARAASRGTSVGRRRARRPRTAVIHAERPDAGGAEADRLPGDSRCRRSRARSKVPDDWMRDTSLPFPSWCRRVDADGNEVAGIRVPELAVPLATTTGWNFRVGARRQPDDALRVARLVHAVCQNEGRARGATRSASVDRGALPGSRRLSAANPRRGLCAREGSIAASGRR